ncbi:hypothetical protein HDV00_005942 [Rhizophlyctis rosea]|nr:hypothetical protein HDV00_005942 [Rhizophlyctis rosea]
MRTTTITTTLLTLLTTTLAAPSSSPITTLPSGGSLLGLRSPSFDEYHNIPFALPPLGEYRWKSPQPPKPWKGVRDARKWGKTCVQFDSNEQYPGNFPLYQFESVIAPDLRKSSYGEDCLNLNVYVPRGGSKKKAVVLFLHGGGLIFGGASQPVLDASYLAASEKDVIVVTANYRLGVFGYLGSSELQHSNTDNSTGNYGFLDQRAALIWIQDNIKSFGGDPSRVILWGQSAGAQSTLWHLIYTNAAAKSLKRQPLFHQVVMNSPNPPLKPLPLASAQNQFNALVTATNCTGATNATTVACLRKLSSDALNKYQQNLWTTMYRKNGAGPFAMVYDNGAITTPGWTAFKSGQYDKTVKIIIGDNANEGTGFIRDDALDGTGDGFANLTAFVSGRFAWVNGTYRDEAVKLYTAQFPKLRDQKTSLYADLVFNCPNRNLARKWSTTNPAVYYYHFSVSTSLTQNTILKGSPHASELISFFRSPLLLKRADEFETAYRMSSDLISYIAKGDPNAEVDVKAEYEAGVKGVGYAVAAGFAKAVMKPVTWPQYKGKGGKVIEFAPKTVVGSDGSVFCDFWDKVFEALL